MTLQFLYILNCPFQGGFMNPFLTVSATRVTFSTREETEKLIRFSGIHVGYV